MSERISFGIEKSAFNRVADGAIFPFLNQHDSMEGVFDEMHEQGQGYLAESLRGLGREIFAKPAFFDMGVTETYDLLPYSLQEELLTPAYVDKIIGILKGSISSSGREVVVNLDWFENYLQDEQVDRLQKIRATKLGPVNGSAYKFGSDAVSIAFGIKKL